MNLKLLKIQWFIDYFVGKTINNTHDKASGVQVIKISTDLGAVSLMGGHHALHWPDELHLNVSVARILVETALFSPFYTKGRLRWEIINLIRILVVTGGQREVKETVFSGIDYWWTIKTKKRKVKGNGSFE